MKNLHLKVGTSRCDVRAATRRNESVNMLRLAWVCASGVKLPRPFHSVPPSLIRAGTSQRDVPTVARCPSVGRDGAPRRSPPRGSQRAGRKNCNSRVKLPSPAWIETLAQSITSLPLPSAPLLKAGKRGAGTSQRDVPTVARCPSVGRDGAPRRSPPCGSQRAGRKNCNSRVKLPSPAWIETLAQSITSLPLPSAPLLKAGKRVAGTSQRDVPTSGSDALPPH